MSRYNANVSKMELEGALAEAGIELAIPVNYSGRIAVGYDRPAEGYFIDLYPDCVIGVWYGKIGFTTRVRRGDLYGLVCHLCDIMEWGDDRDHLVRMANAIAMDTTF